MSKFKVGDIVKYKASFLQSAGMYTNVPVDGKVKATRDSIVYVTWCDRNQVTPVQASNIMLESDPDYSSM